MFRHDGDGAGAVPAPGGAWGAADTGRSPVVHFGLGPRRENVLKAMRWTEMGLLLADLFGIAFCIFIEVNYGANSRLPGKFDGGGSFCVAVLPIVALLYINAGVFTIVASKVVPRMMYCYPFSNFLSAMWLIVVGQRPSAVVSGSYFFNPEVPCPRSTNICTLPICTAATIIGLVQLLMAAYALVLEWAPSAHPSEGMTQLGWCLKYALISVVPMVFAGGLFAFATYVTLIFSVFAMLFSMISAVLGPHGPLSGVLWLQKNAIPASEADMIMLQPLPFPSRDPPFAVNVHGPVNDESIPLAVVVQSPQGYGGSKV